MAKQEGLVPIQGTIDNLTFFKRKDGKFFVRKKGGVSAERIKNDPAFIRTRENGVEFATAAASGKLLRRALHTMMIKGSDDKVNTRLHKIMSKIKNLDSTSVRGLRNVGVGITTTAAQALLKKFDLNNNAILETVLKKAYSVNTSTGVISINNLIPLDHVMFPEGATHVTFNGAWLNIDFANNAYDLQETNAVNMLIDTTVNNVVLTPVAAPVGTGTNLFLLQLQFFQLINNVQYSLKTDTTNSLCIIEII
ncbi:MAG: hypothetical protein JNJ40_06810 [Bacteroidia bacterium]|nr:hypothetical protein [Bacteroidia bacterium]